MKILVQKFGGTSVDSEESRQKAAGKIVRALQDGWRVVVVVSAIGRAGAPYATDTLLGKLKEVDGATPPAARETDLMMACGEIISTVVMAQTLRARGYETIALTGGQAGIHTDYEFGNARILSIDPAYIVRSLEAGRVVFVAGFQGVTQFGAITTLGRGGSDTTASALGAALKPHASEIAVEIYTDVDGVKTADPRLLSDARTLPSATYEEVAEMAHQGAKVVHPRAAEIAHQYRIPLYVKSTFDEGAGTRITVGELGEVAPGRVTGVTHTGKVVYLRFDLPTDSGDRSGRDDREIIELEIYRILQRQEISLYLNTTGTNSFSFAVAREHLGKLRELLDGLIIPVGVNAGAAGPPFGRIYLLGLGGRNAAYAAQRTLIESASQVLTVHVTEADVTENCTMVSVIAARFEGVPGVMAKILGTLAGANVPVYQTSDSAYSISCLVPEADAARAVRALHGVFGLGAAG